MYFIKSLKRELTYANNHRLLNDQNVGMNSGYEMPKGGLVGDGDTLICYTST